MSVKTWKRVIVIAAVVLIVVLGAVAVVFAAKYHQVVAPSGTAFAEDTQEDTGFLQSITLSLSGNGDLAYQNEYSNLYVENDFQYEDIGKKKICYLTFDDGPDEEVTEEVLDVLKQYDVKATFFVTYADTSKERSLYRRMVGEGHTIGIHSASHDYKEIYTSVETYLEDFNRCAEQIKTITGIKSEIFRFPGGSINSYNAGNYQQMIAEMLRRGYTYYDWNVSGADAEDDGISAEEIAANVLENDVSGNRLVVLLHDSAGHQATAEALPSIIEGLQEQGYEFRTLDKSVMPVCFGY